MALAETAPAMGVSRVECSHVREGSLLPLGDYITSHEIWVRTRSGHVRRPGSPHNQYRLFAACAECDGPADVTLYLPPGLPSRRPFQAFVSWDETPGVMVAFQGPPCGTGRRTMEQFAAAGAAGSLEPWEEACRRLWALRQEHDFWRAHAKHQDTAPEHPFRRLIGA